MDSQHAAELEADMQRLRRMLDRVVRPEAAASPLVAQGDVSILDLACGGCDEARTLADFFASLRGEGAPASTRLLGADVRERELDEARERFRSTQGRQFEFLRADGAKLSAHTELERDFDVLFLRHQNLYHGRTLWRKIFDQGLARLREDGLLVITSYFDREHELALEAFRELGMEVVRTERNAESRALVTPGKSVDRHVAVLRKKRGPAAP